MISNKPPTTLFDRLRSHLSLHNAIHMSGVLLFSVSATHIITNPSVLNKMSIIDPNSQQNLQLTLLYRSDSFRNASQKTLSLHCKYRSADPITSFALAFLLQIGFLAD